MNNIKYTLNKHKQKFILGGSILFCIIISLFVYIYISKNKPVTPPDGKTYEDNTVKLADYILTANEAGEVDLVSVKENKSIQSINIGKGKTIYARDNNMEKIMAFNNGVFYEVEEKNKLIKSTKIFQIEDNTIKKFIFNSDYIICFTENELLTISLKDKNISKKPIKNINSSIIYNSKLIYSVDNKITQLDLINNKEKIIDMGEITENIMIYDNDKLIAFNKFGKGKNNYSLFEIRPDDLYINKAYTHNNSNIIPILSDSDDNTVSIMDIIQTGNIKRNSLYFIDFNKDKDKKRLDIPEKIEENNYKDSISTKGYMYTKTIKNIEIFDFRSSNISNTIINDKTFFMPILK